MRSALAILIGLLVGKVTFGLATRTICIIFVGIAVTLAAAGQGVFYGSNASARTRIGALDGSLAETNIFGQFFAGPNVTSLSPLGSPSEHMTGGVFFVGNVTVPDVPAFASAFVQLWAWDSRWGNDVSNVPADQIGMTDVVSVFLTRGEPPDVVSRPGFTLSAVVPVPEPHTITIFRLAVVAICLRSIRFCRDPRAWKGRTPTKAILFILIGWTVASVASAQGVFIGSNGSTLTRVGSPEGPLAGTNILGEFFGGASSDSLNPLGMPTPHLGNGMFFADNLSVADVPPFLSAFVQFLAWDSAWGNDVTKVPADQIGATDIVSVLLTRGVFPDIVVRPLFTYPAIVPVPEPTGHWFVAAAVISRFVVKAFSRRGVTRI